jgi:hypothetical protein
MSVLTSYNGSRDNYSNFGTAATFGQSFKIPFDGIVTSCKIAATQGGFAATTFKIEIRSGSTTGTVILTTGTINISLLPAYNPADTSTTSFGFTSSATLIANTTYFLVGTVVSGHATDGMRWFLDTTSPSYTDGSFYNNGTADTAADALFSIDGVFPNITSAVTNISLTTATGNGEVVSDGGYTITERGFVWAVTTVPTTANSKVVVTGTVGVYSGALTGLSVNTLYYVRTYYTNSQGTSYGNEVSFTTLNINQYELQYPGINAVAGETFVGQINVEGTVGTVTIQLGTTGTATVINAGAGATAFSGTYRGLSGLIITRSATFNGTVDNVYYARLPLGTTVAWTANTFATITAVNSSVFFKRIEDDVFNSFRFYRYLDILFKDLDGYVTVTVRDEREDNTSEKTKTFSVGNTVSGTVSPFQKKRISFLIKNQAVIIGVSNASIGETFSIAKFILTGHKKPTKMFSPSKIQSV